MAAFELKGPMKRYRSRAFKLNEFLNGTQRTSTAIVKLERVLTEQGRTLDEVTPELYATDPVIRDAVNDTVRATNEALGAFSELTPFEKKYMRSIYPFWSWIKFANTAAAQMVVDNPDRVLLMVHLGSLATDPDDNEMFDWLRGKVPVAGQFYDLSFVNPFQDAIIFAANPVAEFGESLTGVSPVITNTFRAFGIPYYYMTGRTSNIPFASLQRPGYLEGRPGSTTRGFGDLVGELGYLGLRSFGGPLRNLPDVATALPFVDVGDRIPFTDVALGPVQRYPQGSPRTTGAFAQPRLSPIAGGVSAALRTFGIPAPLADVSKVQEQGRLQRQRDTAARLRRIRERQASLR